MPSTPPSPSSRTGARSRLKPRIDRQVIGRHVRLAGSRSDQPLALLVVQQWSGFTAGRHAIAISINLSVTSQRADMPDRVAAEFARYTAGIPARQQMTEAQAREFIVAELGLPGEYRCDDQDCRTPCKASCPPGCDVDHGPSVLPLGFLYCLNCGRPHAAHPEWSPVWANATVLRVGAARGGDTPSGAAGAA